jgi:hypothetical protein
MTTMTPRQEKRHREINNSLARAQAQREAMIAGLIRAEARLKEMQRARQRLDKAIAKPKPEPVTKPALPEGKPLSADLVKQVTEAIGHPPVKAALDDAIPAFLDRRSVAQKKDDEARERIERDNAERKTAKAKQRIEKLKVRQEIKHAALTGELRKMPLTGRAALDKIRHG